VVVIRRWKNRARHAGYRSVFDLPEPALAIG